MKKMTINEFESKVETLRVGFHSIECGIKGLGVHKSPSDNLTWAMRYTDKQTNKRHMLKIGDYLDMSLETAKFIVMKKHEDNKSKNSPILKAIEQKNAKKQALEFKQLGSDFLGLKLYSNDNMQDDELLDYTVSVALRKDELEYLLNLVSVKNKTGIEKRIYEKLKIYKTIGISEAKQGAFIEDAT